MFGAVTDLLNRATNIDHDKLWLEAIDREVQFQIIFLNTKDQLKEDGVDSLDNPLYSSKHGRGVYSVMTEQLTQGRKSAGDHYTLEDTGRFYASFVVRADINGFEIVANTLKENTDLAEEYGIDILGLTDENHDIIKKLIQEKYVENLLENGFLL